METTWLGLAPAILLAVLLLLGPGVLVLRAAGFDARTAVLAAAPISQGLLVAAGLAVGLAGWSWTLPVGLGALAIATGAGVLLGRVVRRRSGVAAGEALSSGGWLRLALVLAACLAVVWITAATAIPSPATIPQMPDVVFHLGATEWMVRHGSASVLDVTRYAGTDALSYPGGLHPLLATVAGWTGLLPIVAAHAVLLATMGVIWPMGMMLLARVALGPAPAVIATAGVTSVLFTSFPYRFLAWGPLWANLFSFALFPAVAAIALCAVAPRPLLTAQLPVTRGPAQVYAVLGLVVLAVCQPNSVASGLVLAAVLLWWAVPLWRARATRPWLRRLLTRPVLLLALIGLVLASRPLIPPVMFGTNAHVLVPPMQAVGDLVTLVDGTRGEAVLLFGLVLLGAVRLARHRRSRWIVAFLGAASVLFVACYGFMSPAVRTVTWLWWNDEVRLRAMTVPPAVLAATAGLAWLGSRFARWVGSSSLPRSRATVVLTLIVVVAMRGGIPGHGDAIETTYTQSAPSWSWATPAEQAALRELASHVPAGAVVAANPWRGGMFLYVLADTEILYPTQYSLALPDRRIIGARLDRLQTDREVCAAVQRQRVGFVITGGESHIWGYYENVNYAGIDATPLNGAFTVVAASGPYVLRAVPTCQAPPASP